MCWYLLTCPRKIGRTPWRGDQPVARSLPTHRRTQTQNKRTQAFAHSMGFELMIPAFKWAKAVHALDRVATVFGYEHNSVIGTVVSGLDLQSALEAGKRLQSSSRILLWPPPMPAGNICPSYRWKCIKSYSQLQLVPRLRITGHLFRRPPYASW
jgi:hypothetical protein